MNDELFMNEVKIVTLVSCMHQHDKSIIELSNIQTDAVVVNQCDYDKVEEYDYTNKSGLLCHVRFICTRERGLSRSRNMAITNSWGDICVLCDDDEHFEDDYGTNVLHQFERNPSYAIIAFKLIYNRKKFGEKEVDYNRFTAMSLSSAQLAFRRDDVIRTGISFDEMLGSGSGNGGGEENKFLFQLLGKGLKAKYVPILLAEVKSNSKSLWFDGYTSQYIINEGWGYRRIFGSLFAYPLLWFHAIKHFKSYKCNFFRFIYLLHKGFFIKK